MRRILFCFAVYLTLFGNVPELRAANDVPAEKFFNATGEVVTPHIEWLKPYHSGKVKVLFITHRSGMREMIEITQRMDLNYSIFAYARPDSFVHEDLSNSIAGTGQREEEERLKNLLAADYELIVLGNVNWKVLPLSCRYLILEKVKKGAGLMGIVRERDSVLKQILAKTDATEKTTARKELAGALSSLALRQLPVFSKMQDVNSLVDTFEIGIFGKGRICLFYFPPGGDTHHGPFHPLTPCPKNSALEINMADYDYHMTLLIKTMLWAAKREPSLIIKPAGSFFSFDQSALNKEQLKFSLSSGEKETGTARLVFRNARGKEISVTERKITVVQGESSLSFNMTFLPAGTYFADLWIKDPAGAVVNFASVQFEVNASSSIRDIVLEKDNFLKSEEIKGKITLNNPAEGQFIRITQTDNMGRIVGETKIPAGQNSDEIPFRLTSCSVITIMQNITADLLSVNGTVMDTKNKLFSISDLYAPVDEIRLAVWAQVPVNCYMVLPFLQYLYQSGVDSQYVNFTEWVPMANLWHIPYATRIIDLSTDWYNTPTREKSDAVRNPCLTDPEYLEKTKEQLTKCAKLLGRFSVRDYSLGDECHFTGGKYDLCFSPTCIADFRKFVEKQYGDIRKLNDEYGAEYKSFQEVMPINIDEARKTGNVACWIDHRRHMDSVWAGTFAYLRKAIQDVVPGARVGYEGSDWKPSTWLADDYWKLAGAMNMDNIYYQPFACATMRSFLPEKSLFGAGWMGGYNENRSVPYMKYFTWYSLLKGANSYWAWFAAPSTGAVTAPDFSFYPFFKEGLKQIKEIKEGIGKSMILSERQTDIAVLYSPSSIHTDTFLGEPMGPIADLLETTVQVFLDMGFQPGIISYEQLADGKLDKPVLYLPYCQALSQKETEAIKRFVRNGGCLIADLRAGVRNEHGNPYKTGTLDEVFGVKTEAQGELKRGELKLSDGQVFPDIFYDASLKPASGTPAAKAGETPAIISNTYGKGRTLLLNFAFPEYYRKAQPDTGEDFSYWKRTSSLRNLINILLSGEGITPPVKVTPEIPGLEITRFRSGKIEYVGILQGLPKAPIAYSSAATSLPSAETARIVFQDQAHLYDAREKKYIGFTDEIKTEIRPSEAMIFARMPYKIDGIKVTLADPTLKQGDSLNYQVNMSFTGKCEPQTHIIRIRILNPAGIEIPYYSENLVLNGIKAEGRIALALNEIPGTYTVQAQEIISGESRKVTFAVTKR